MHSGSCGVVAVAIFVCACGVQLEPSFAPDRPQNLRLLAGSPTVLAWDSVEKADGYRIYRSSLWNSWPPVNDKETPDSSIAVDANGYYTVTAYNSGGESGLAEPPVLLGPPATPQAVHIEKDGFDHFLRWDPVFGAETYTIYYDANCHPSPFPPTTSMAGIVATEYQLFVSGRCYWVAAVAAGGESEIAEEEVAYY